MIRLIHSADWQIGARFRQFGDNAEMLRNTRLATLRKALEHAASVRADAFLIAGDLFEDNQIEPATVRQVYELLAEFKNVRVFIVPGNHDPFTGPGSIWGRPPFSKPPPNVTIFTERAAKELDGAVIFGNPLTQKTSTQDPSAKLGELAARHGEKIKIGITHGSLAIDGMHQPDDFPIALNAATRAGLDYLAIGHWHSAQLRDGGRLSMPGTPEPTDFSEHGAGCVCEVEIAVPGAQPRVTQVRMAKLRWQEWEFDFTDAQSAREQIAKKIKAQCSDGADLTCAVVRVVLKGSASPAMVEETTDWLHSELKDCAVCDVQDRTTLEFSAAELSELTREHPLIAQVLLDLESAQAQLTGVVRPGPAQLYEAISHEDLRRLCDEAKIETGTLDARFFSTAQRVLLHHLREAAHAD
jgi:DNA repair exonuclease SbcCD nuclease subunit